MAHTGTGTTSDVYTANAAGTGPTFQPGGGGGGGSATAFFAYLSSNASNVTGADVIYTVIFDTTTRNDGGMYFGGVVTVAKTGFYTFNTVLFLTSGSTFTAGSEILVSGQGSVQTQIITLLGVAAARTTPDNSIIVAGNWSLQMNAGDSMSVEVLSSSSLQDVSIIGGAISPNQFTAMSSFSGFLVGT